VNVKNYALNFLIFNVILEGMLRDTYNYDDIFKKNSECNFYNLLNIWTLLFNGLNYIYSFMVKYFFFFESYFFLNHG